MANPVAAYAKKVQIAPDSSGSIGTPADLNGNATAGLDLKGETIDVSTINSDGFRKRIAGLRDASVNCECFYLSSDTAQGTLAAAYFSGAPVWAKIFLTGSAGIVGQFLVESWNTSEGAADAIKANFTLTLAGTGTSPLATF